MDYRKDLRPKYGFTILSNGEVLRGAAGTYTEDQVAQHYAKWIVMKAAGCFQRPHNDRESAAEVTANNALPSTKDGLDTMD